MKRLNLSTEVISDARDDLKAQQARIDRADAIHDDLGGFGENSDTLALTSYGPYIVVDDGQDRWVTDIADYQQAMDAVLEEQIEKGSYDEDDSECYNALCAGTTCLYSRIGSGKYNSDLAGLVKKMEEGGASESDIEDIFEEIGEEIPEVAIAE